VYLVDHESKSPQLGDGLAIGSRALKFRFEAAEFGQRLGGLAHGR
jgi:hypothetical protein